MNNAAFDPRIADIAADLDCGRTFNLKREFRRQQ